MSLVRLAHVNFYCLMYLRLTPKSYYQSKADIFSITDTNVIQSYISDMLSLRGGILQHASYPPIPLVLATLCHINLSYVVVSLLHHYVFTEQINDDDDDDDDDE